MNLTRNQESTRNKPTDSITVQIPQSQIKYWQRVLIENPIIDNIDKQRIPLVVEQLQKLHETNRDEFWRKVTKMVDQLQHCDRLFRPCFPQHRAADVKQQVHGRRSQQPATIMATSYAGVGPPLQHKSKSCQNNSTPLKELLLTLFKYVHDPKVTTNILCRMQEWLNGTTPQEAKQRVSLFASSDGVATLVRVLRNSQKSHSTQRQVLSTLATAVQYRRDIGAEWIRAGGVSPLLNAMEVLAGDSDVQEWSLGVLASPSIVNNSVVRVDPIRICELARKAIKNFPSVGRIQAFGFLTMANLAMKDDANVIMLMEIGIEQTVMERLLDVGRQSDSHLMTSCVWLLVAMSEENTVAVQDRFGFCQRLLERGCAGIVKELLRVHPTHQGIQEYCTTLFDRLVKFEYSTEQKDNESDQDCVVQ